MSFRHGKSGSAVVGADALKILKWAAKDAADLEESSNTSSGGKKEWTAGFEGVDVSLEAQWDAANGPFAAPPALIPGTELSNVGLGISTSANGYTFTKLIVESADITMAVKNVITWTISAKSQGAFTRPTI